MREYDGYDLDKLEEAIADMYDDDLYQAVYEYCEYVGYEVPFDYDILEDYINNMDPEEAFRLGQFSDISMNADLYIFNGYGNLEETSVNEFVNDYRDEPGFAEFIVDNNMFDELDLIEDDFIVQDEEDEE